MYGPNSPTAAASQASPAQLGSPPTIIARSPTGGWWWPCQAVTLGQLSTIPASHGSHTCTHKCSLLAAGSSSNVPVSSRLRFLPLETETDGQSHQANCGVSSFLLGDLRPDAQIPDIERRTLVLLQRSRCPVPPKTASLVQNDGSGVLI